jgi:hypothetical protein
MSKAVQADAAINRDRSAVGGISADADSMALLATRFYAVVEAARQSAGDGQHALAGRRFATVAAARALAVTRADRRLVETANHMDDARQMATQISTMPAVSSRDAALQREVARLLVVWRV